MFLQLHDGPDMPYGLRPFPYPKRSGPMMPVRFAEDPFAPGSPVMQTTPYRLLAGCDQAQVYADFVPQNANGWKVRLDQVSQGQQLVKNYQTYELLKELAALLYMMLLARSQDFSRLARPRKLPHTFS
jgi:hypothetical protein